jgi:hypothetical protein
MEKIPTMFERDWQGDKSRVLDSIHPDCVWVADGEGWATRKMDGTSCMIRGGKMFKRREIKSGGVLPPGFEVASTDLKTGKTVGWVPVGDGDEDRWHREAFAALESKVDGTYELVGPKVQGNPERWVVHALISHTSPDLVIADVPRSFAGLTAWLEGKNIEGVVFHHKDGRMAKIKLRDFGLKRP